MDKTNYRAKHLFIRQQMYFSDVSRKSEKIAKRILEADFFNQSCNVFGYIAMKNEVDCLFIKDMVNHRGYDFLVPRVIDKKDMAFSPYVGPEQLKKSTFGVMEPKVGSAVYEPREGDLILVPGCCFDLKGNRIGYGGGYYDNYLNAHPGLIKVGLAYENHLENQLPYESKDQIMDYIVTEDRVIKIKKK